MYNVSSDYLTKLQSRTKAEKISGTLHMQSGDITLTESNFLPSTTSINKTGLASSSIFTVGAVVASELKTGLYLPQIEDRYSLFGASITLTHYLLVGSDPDISANWEAVPLGTFYITNAERASNKNSYTVTAYDALYKLNTPIRGVIYEGVPFVILSLICSVINVPLGMTQQEMSALPNSDVVIRIDETNNISTLTEIVIGLAQMMGCFAMMDRSGGLVMRPFSSTKCITLRMADRYMYTPSDYTMDYGNLIVNGAKGEFESHVTKPAIYRLATMHIDNALAWDFGEAEDLQEMADNVLLAVAELYFTPATLDMPNAPIFDCGDLLEIETEDPDESMYFLVTTINWVFRGHMTLNCEAENPYFSENQNNQTTRKAQNNNNASNYKLTMVHYTNAEEEEYSIDEGEEVEYQLCHLTFTSKAETAVVVFFSLSAVFDGHVTTVQISIPVHDGNGNDTSMTLDNGNSISTISASIGINEYSKHKVSFKLVYDDIVLDFKPVILANHGEDIISFHCPILKVSERATHDLALLLVLEDGAQSVTIEPFGLQVTLMGQNLADIDTEWDGTITLHEAWSVVAPVMPVLNLSDDVDVDILDNDDVSISDNTSIVTPVMSTKTLTGTVDITMAQPTFDIITEDGYDIITEDGYNIVTE